MEIKPYRLQPVTEAMLPQIAEIEVLCFSAPMSESILRHQLDNSLCHLFAATDPKGDVVGYAGMLTVLDEGYVENIAVHPSFRRTGIGGALLRRLLEQGQAQKLAFLTLEVRESNFPAQALYKKYGFSPVGIRKNYYDKPKESAILMTKFFHDLVK